MSNYRLWLTLLLLGSISLGIFGCSSDEEKDLETEISNSETIQSNPDIDLSLVFEKRIEGKNEEAIALLRSLNEHAPRIG